MHWVRSWCREIHQYGSCSWGSFGVPGETKKQMPLVSDLRGNIAQGLRALTLRAPGFKSQLCHWQA